MDSMRCQYASKPCDQPRTFKDNGELHRLCLYHRTRANDAQRRWHSRQRCAAAADTDPIERATKSETIATREVSARTKRRRRAAQQKKKAVIAHPYRRPEAITGELKSAMAAVSYTPTSPPSVDSSSFYATLGAFENPYELSPDQDRLSAEDLALLDELMMSIEDPQLPGLETMEPSSTGFFDMPLTAPMVLESPMRIV